MTPPVFRIKFGTNLDAEAECTDFLDATFEETSKVGSETGGNRLNRMRCTRDFGNRILRAGCSFDVTEKKNPFLVRKLAAEFLDDTGLSHAPLSGQQHMVPVLNQPFQDS